LLYKLPGALNFVYKARERIHGIMSDMPLLAIPTS